MIPRDSAYSPYPPIRKGGDGEYRQIGSFLSCIPPMGRLGDGASTRTTNDK